MNVSFQKYVTNYGFYEIFNALNETQQMYDKKILSQFKYISMSVDGNTINNMSTVSVAFRIFNKGNLELVYGKSIDVRKLDENFQIEDKLTIKNSAHIFSLLDF